MKDLELLVTLWPDFPHFSRFASDPRIAAVRLNTAMADDEKMAQDLEAGMSVPCRAPLYFDVKGRQLRVTESMPYKDHLELLLNHPIKVKTPTMVLFKAGADYALLDRIVDGNRLVFDGGPQYMVYKGESLHIRDPGLQVQGPLFLDYEKERIEKAKKAGFNRFFLSYVESQYAIDQFRELVGDSEIVAKIENKAGLRYVATEFRKAPNLWLLAARGDLYVEVDRPHDMLSALKLIASKDPEAGVGSRILLSIVNKEVPEMSDLADMAWLYDIGYRKMMLCDDVCLKEEPLTRAVNIFESFRQSYAMERPEISSRRYRVVGTFPDGTRSFLHKL